MRVLPLTVVISVAAHVVAAATFFVPKAGPATSDPAPLLAGETFELPAPETTEVPLANASPAPEGVTTAEPPLENHADGDAPPRSSVPAQGPMARRPSPPRRPSAGRAAQGASDGDTTSAAAPALYGAVGERSAADLATAFTRGFPQAASADPIWHTAPLGSAGEAEIVLTLDESGHIEHTRVVGAPSPALASAIGRTLALIKGRPFVARGKVTRLHLVASVSADVVHDGLHGDVFAVGGSYSGGEGSAFFALAIGRRIDVRVRAK